MNRLSPPTERDAFDTLLDHAPDKLNVVKTVRFPSRSCHCLTEETCKGEVKSVNCVTSHSSPLSTNT